MPNLSALEQFTTKSTALSGLILVSPQATVGYQPENPPNVDGSASTAPRPPAFLFNYEGEQTLNLQSDITDHYVEENYSIEDHIALKPEEFSTHGFVGELTDIAPDLLKPVKAIADKLTTVVAFEPEKTIAAQIAYNTAFQLYQVGRSAVNSAVSAWSTVENLFTGSDGQNVIGSGGLGNQFDFATGNVRGVQNKQQTAFQQLYGYWSLRTLFTIQTPWAVFQNMAIKNLKAFQDAETNQITDFEVTFKMIRIAKTQTGLSGLTGLLDLFQGRSKAQASGVTNLGTSSPVPSDSLSSKLAGLAENVPHPKSNG